MCLVVVVLLFPAVPWICLQLVSVVFPDHTHLLYLSCYSYLTCFLSLRLIYFLKIFLVEVINCRMCYVLRSL